MLDPCITVYRAATSLTIRFRVEVSIVTRSAPHSPGDVTTRPWVGLFVTCLVDLFRPSIGFAAVKLLEDAGCAVDVPTAQTCCGQPAYNSGDSTDTRAIAKRTIEAFESFDYVVAPSGSCAGMLREHYPQLFPTGADWQARAQSLADRTHELSSFLTDVLGAREVDTRFEAHATYHDSCSGLREMEVRDQPRDLLASVGGLRLTEMRDAGHLLRLRRDVLRQVPRNLHPPRRREVRERARDRGRGAARGRPGVPAEHRGTPHPGIAPGAGVPRRGGARRHGRTRDRRARTMKSTAHDFPARARSALNNSELARAMLRARTGFIDRRLAAVEGLPEYESVRRTAREIKEHTLHHLDYYLERFEERVQEHGGHVHWASTPAEAQAIVIDICRAAGAKRVTKGKSMVGEEIALNDALEAAGFEPIETDLGEYIIQLANEPPSHIIAPAIHKTKDQISDLFHAHHAKYGRTERQTEPTALVGEARAVLREKFQSADVGITGANFLVAETGSTVIVTNEGNGDLTNTLPRVHIVTAGIEKVVPTLDDMSTILRVLARSATGQETAVYTTLSSGPRRAGDLDGPGEYHVVLLDNGRSQMLGNEFHEMLRCIRCGACMNHCPVYHAVGGHAYGWVYVGSDGRGADPADGRTRRGPRIFPMHAPSTDDARKCVRWRSRSRI